MRRDFVWREAIWALGLVDPTLADKDGFRRGGGIRESAGPAEVCRAGFRRSPLPCALDADDRARCDRAEPFRRAAIVVGFSALRGDLFAWADLPEKVPKRVGVELRRAIPVAIGALTNSPTW